MIELINPILWFLTTSLITLVGVIAWMVIGYDKKEKKANKKLRGDK